MAPKKGPLRCQICSAHDHKYTCPQCRIVYCSLACYKKHKEFSCAVADASVSSNPAQASPAGVKMETSQSEVPLENPTPHRPLTSLTWPYVPDESAFPDPLKRDDPKTLQLPQYEAIATSPSIRNILTENKNLPELLTTIDKLRGPDREHALQKALGITAPEIDDQLGPRELSEDVIAFRKLAEAIEDAVRGGKEGALGLDWGD